MPQPEAINLALEDSDPRSQHPYPGQCQPRNLRPAQKKGVSGSPSADNNYEQAGADPAGHRLAQLLTMQANARVLIFRCRPLQVNRLAQTPTTKTTF